MKGGSGGGDDDDGARGGDDAHVSGPHRRDEVYLASPSPPLVGAGSQDVSGAWEPLVPWNEASCCG